MAEVAAPALQVVIDDTPQPAGELLEVLPADLAGTASTRAIPRLIPIEPLAPRRSAGLVKVDAVVAPAPTPKPVRAVPVAIASVQRTTKPEPMPAKAIVAKVDRDKDARPAKTQKAIAKAKPKASVVRVAKADKTKVQKKAQPKAATTKLAKAEPKPKAKVRAQETRRIAVQAKSAKAAPKKVLAKAKSTVASKKKQKVELAQAKPKAVKPKVMKAKAAKPAPRPKVETARAERKPAPRPVVPRGEGPLRVAKADACASHDPGEALVCADRRLAARDRQMQQAYRDAEAAGVPASALRRQQSRWVQARAAAAREAPWAVEDVYVARISELHDLSRDAREN